MPRPGMERPGRVEKLFVTARHGRPAMRKKTMHPTRRSGPDATGLQDLTGFRPVSFGTISR